MFAGAAREAVFSRRDVVAKIREGFVPVAIKAGLMNNPPPGIEGAFLREIRRTKLAPQGICGANSDGKVLAWALSFDDELSVPRFLDHILTRYERYPDATEAVDCERFMSFPSHARESVDDTRERLPKVAAHGDREHCVATPPKPRGTLTTRVWGRAVDANGQLSEKCHQQDEYIEDVFDIPLRLQSELTREVARIQRQGRVRVRVPDELSRLLVTYTYLGQLDARLIDSPVPAHETDVRELEFWAKPVATGNGVTKVRLRGDADILCRRPRSQDRRGPRRFLHEIELAWEGELTLRGDRIVDLALFGEGREKLQWNAGDDDQTEARQSVRRLPGGRTLNIDTRVRYGLLAGANNSATSGG